MNEKARKRAHYIYFKILEYLRPDFTGTLNFKVSIRSGGITRAFASFEDEVIFTDMEDKK
ncbi:MAG: hypothetical protein GY820_38720 [Gammaproteobacteria bacterium]|nr:hypothetical protein [Gammaproteobacteria bacterium]